MTAEGERDSELRSTDILVSLFGEALRKATPMQVRGPQKHNSSIEVLGSHFSAGSSLNCRICRATLPSLSLRRTAWWETSWKSIACICGIRVYVENRDKWLLIHFRGILVAKMISNTIKSLKNYIAEYQLDLQLTIPRENLTRTPSFHAFMDMYEIKLFTSLTWARCA